MVSIKLPDSIEIGEIKLKISEHKGRFFLCLTPLLPLSIGAMGEKLFVDIPSEVLDNADFYKRLL